MKQLLILVLMLWGGVILAQKTVSGTILDEGGDGLIGASVILPGTTTGTVTDFDGSFSLEVPSNTQELQISYVGFQTMMLDVSGNDTKNMTINMLGGEILDEIVMIGYGSQKRQQLTGSVTSVSSEDIESVQNSHIVKGLVGKIPGVQIVQQNGQPGAAPSIRFRGVGSLRSSNAPLYVVDGSPFLGNINSIATQDIESINFLKDASVNALYGSRGANGVIVITTKKGKKPGVEVTLDSKIGFSDRAIKDYDIITDPGEFYEAHYDRIRIGDIVSNGTDASEAAQAAAAGLISGGAFSLGYNNYDVADDQVIDPATGKLRPGLTPKYQDDWEEELFDNNLRGETHLSIRSSGEQVDAMFSVGFLDDAGYALNSGFERYTGRFGLDFNVNDNITIGGNLNYASTNQDAPVQNVGSGTYSNLFSWARNVAPIYPVFAYDENGSQMFDKDGGVMYDFGQLDDGVPGVRPYGAFNNPVATSLLDIDQNKNNNLSGRAYVSVDFLKNFNFRYNFAVDGINQDITAFATPIGGDASNVNGRLTTTSTTSRNVSNQQFLEWYKPFGDHAIKIMAGHESNDWGFNLVRGQKTENLIPDIAILNNGASTQYLEGYEKDYRTEGYLARINYDFRDKFFVNASVRRDASSIFHPDNRWGTFYGFGLAYDLHKESFLSSSKLISQLRIKGSVGQLGNDQLLYVQNRTIVGDLDNRNYYLYKTQYDVVNAGGGVPGVLFVAIGSEDVTWEESTNMNAGFELGLFNNRVSIGVEYFKRQVKNLLSYEPGPLSNNLDAFPKNIGDMENNGVELELSADIIRKSDFSWNISMNATHFKNELTSLPQEFIDDPDNTRFRWEEGRSRYDYYMRDYAGVDETNGDALWYMDELDGEGNPTGNRITTADYSSADEYFLEKTAIPDFYGGLNTSINYKGIGLGVGFAYQVGGYGYDGTYAGLLPSAGDIGHNFHKDILDSWTPENTTSSIPRFDVLDDDQNNLSSYFLTSLTYFSLQDVTLSYDFGANLLSNIGIDRARIYATADNLALWSDRQGYDPRLSTIGNSSNEYSIVRRMSLGLTLTF